MYILPPKLGLGNTKETLFGAHLNFLTFQFTGFSVSSHL